MQKSIIMNIYQFSLGVVWNLRINWSEKDSEYFTKATAETFLTYGMSQKGRRTPQAVYFIIGFSSCKSLCAIVAHLNV